jgi:thioredoxin-like negative regulator of GroEL
MKMSVNLDQGSIDDYVKQPGVALVNWHSPRQATSAAFDVGLENVSARHPDVHFADVDVTKDPALAASWGVPGAPELMVFRDGTLVFDYAGVLPESAVEALLEAIWSLDMEQIRKGVNGHGARGLD